MEGHLRTIDSLNLPESALCHHSFLFGCDIHGSEFHKMATVY